MYSLKANSAQHFVKPKILYPKGLNMGELTGCKSYQLFFINKGNSRTRWCGVVSGIMDGLRVNGGKQFAKLIISQRVEFGKSNDVNQNKSDSNFFNKGNVLARCCCVYFEAKQTKNTSLNQ